jgi:hypothetical protein
LEDSQSVPGHDPVLAEQRHEIRHRAQRHEIQMVAQFDAETPSDDSRYGAV